MLHSPLDSPMLDARHSFDKRQCLACTDPIPACPACTATQSCIQIGRSCNQCPQSICRNNATASSSSSDIGATIGGALGGVLGIVAAVAVVYWFWWKPRGLAASRRRYSKHVVARQSRMMAAAPEKKQEPSSSPPTTPAAGALDGTAVGHNPRSSVHLTMDLDDPLRPISDDFGAPSTAAATGGHTLSGSIDFDEMMDNPFGDHARSSVGTSDFSFRSSHSTNIIPIAYIPPHSNSMSLDDANRGAYGELMHDNPNPERIMGGHRSIPASLASRDSLILAGADQIDLHPLPPVLNPGNPLVPLGASAGGAPIRPPRSPGLDLQLPKGMSPTTSTLHSPTSPSGSGGRPPSGFPWSAPPPTAGSGSHFSATTNRTSTNSYLSAPGGGDKSRGMSFLLESHGGPRVTAAQSHLSTMSTATSRSTNSTMSYILDPPQIITPVNAQGLRRVEITGRGQAGLVRLPGNNASGATPPLPSSSTLQTSTASSPTTPKAFVRQQQSSPLAQEDPFSDTARFSVGGIASPATRTRARSDSASTLDDPGYVTESGGYGGQSDSSRWTMSSAGSRMSHAQIIAVSPSNQALAAAAGASSFYDVPHSARSSAVSVGELAYDTGSRARPLTNDSFADSRSSFVSSRAGMTDSMSMLDGIPFMQPPTNISAGDLTKPPSSPLFPMPPPRSPSFNAPASPTPSIAASSLAPRSEHRGSQYSYDTSYSDNSLAEAAAAPSGLGLNLPSSSATSLAQVISADDRNTSPLPAPFLPFAGQRPTSNTATIGPPPPPAVSRVLSQAISVRSGFGSGLSQIPFQLGFPSGLDETASERDSFMTASSRDSRQPGGGRRYSNNREAEGDGEDDGMLSGVEEQTEPPESSGYATSTFSRASMQSNHTTATVGVAALRAVGEAEGEGLDPFGEHAEVKEGRGADVRASTDTLALSAELARSFGALGDD